MDSLFDIAQGDDESFFAYARQFHNVALKITNLEHYTAFCAIEKD